MNRGVSNDAAAKRQQAKLREAFTARKKAAPAIVPRVATKPQTKCLVDAAQAFSVAGPDELSEAAAQLLSVVTTADWNTLQLKALFCAFDQTITARVVRNQVLLGSHSLRVLELVEFTALEENNWSVVGKVISEVIPCGPGSGSLFTAGEHVRFTKVSGAVLQPTGFLLTDAREALVNLPALLAAEKVGDDLSDSEESDESDKEEEEVEEETPRRGKRGADKAEQPPGAKKQKKGKGAMLSKSTLAAEFAGANEVEAARLSVKLAQENLLLLEGRSVPPSIPASGDLEKSFVASKNRGKCLNGVCWDVVEQTGMLGIAKVQFLLRVWDRELVDEVMPGLKFEMLSLLQHILVLTRKFILQDNKVVVDIESIERPQFERLQEVSDHPLSKKPEKLEAFVLGKGSVIDSTDIGFLDFAGNAIDSSCVWGKAGTKTGRLAVSRMTQSWAEFSSVYHLVGVEEAVIVLRKDLAKPYGIYEYHSDYVVMHEVWNVIATWTHAMKHSKVVLVNGLECFLDTHVAQLSYLVQLFSELRVTAQKPYNKVWEFDNYVSTMKAFTLSSLVGGGSKKKKAIADDEKPTKIKERLCHYWVGNQLKVMNTQKKVIYQCPKSSAGCTWKHAASLKSITTDEFKEFMKLKKIPNGIRAAVTAAGLDK